MKNIIVPALLAAALSVSGCSSFDLKTPDPQTGELKDTPLVPKASTSAVTFFAERCPLSDRDGAVEAFFLGPVLGAAGLAIANATIPPLIETALGLTADYFEGRARALNASTTSSANGNLFARAASPQAGARSSSSVKSPFKPAFGCLVFVRGRLHEAGTKPQPTERWSPGTYQNVNAQLANVPSLNSFQLTSPPEVYAEFQVVTGASPVFAADGSPSAPPQMLYHSLGLRPVYVDYAVIGTERKGDGEKNVMFDITLNSRSLRLGKTDPSTVLHALVDLGKVKQGAIQEPVDLAAKTAQMFRMPQPGVYPLTSEKASPITDDLIPVTATVIMTETEQGGDYERAFAEALRKNKAEIAKQASAPILTEVKEILDRAFPPKPAK